MPRPEKHIEGPAAEFAAGLRQVRAAAGKPTYKKLAKLANYSPTTLSRAASGRRVPSWGATEAYVRLCGGDVDEWRQRWDEERAHASS